MGRPVSPDDIQLATRCDGRVHYCALKCVQRSNIPVHAAAEDSCTGKLVCGKIIFAGVRR
jgi:hypothetical protein